MQKETKSVMSSHLPIFKKGLYSIFGLIPLFLRGCFNTKQTTSYADIQHITYLLTYLQDGGVKDKPHKVIHMVVESGIVTLILTACLNSSRVKEISISGSNLQAMHILPYQQIPLRLMTQRAMLESSRLVCITFIRNRLLNFHF